ncbi:MAG: hypothetical protein KA067_03895 [Prevotella sp.]|nr:hypothetical protein [Prevotella sp.]
MDLKRRLLCAIVALVSLSAAAENKVHTVYLYGFAASFNDSTVYFTPIQQLDSAYIDSKTKFLYSRENYSYQLRDYLAGSGYPNATCITSYALNRKDAEKKYLALRKRYSEKGKYIVNDLKEEEFRFLPIAPNP